MSPAELGDDEGAAAFKQFDADLTKVSLSKKTGLLNPHMLFWVGLSVMILWYIAFAFNLPKSKFLMVFGLLGTFIGIPVVLEFSGWIQPFTWLASALGSFTPEVNAGGWFVLALTFGGIWLGNFIYSRTHLRVRIDDDGLTLNQLGGKGERFELVGLKTENEPIDYLELFLAGVGSLSLKTRMNKPIFKMNRVIGLYRTPWFPFFPSKLSKIEALLNSSSAGGNYQERLDAAEMSDSEGDGGDENDIGEETYNQDRKGGGHSSTDDNPGEIT